MKYVSDLKELSNSRFNTIEELEKAEAEVKKVNEEKALELEKKKVRAKEVEDAYLEYQKVKEECYKKMAEAEKKWLELRDKFAEDYHGYHMTYVNKNGEKQVTFGDLLDCFFNW